MTIKVNCPDEERDNVRFVHEDAIVPDSIYTRKPLEWFVGKTIKMAFQSAMSIVEHMWVEIGHIDGGDLVGTLTNRPIFVEDISTGDVVRLRRVQIEAVNLNFDEWIEEAKRLQAKGDYFNRLLGQPLADSEFEKAYDERLTPRQALKRWRDFIPSNSD